MSRTYRVAEPYANAWNPGRGKFVKRAYHKAERAVARRHGGRVRSVARAASELARKGH